MKERPILFKAEMVRAILAGTKTQTRRLVKFIPELGDPESWCHRAGTWKFCELVGPYENFCPHGRRTDRLWVKETFCPVVKPVDDGRSFAPAGYVYRATHDGTGYDGSWKPSIFCTRKASRITLEITGVRVERLNACSESDALAEGVDVTTCRVTSQLEAHAAGRCCSVDYVDGYRKLWESINGAGSWALNPWVWVIEFRRVNA